MFSLNGIEFLFLLRFTGLLIIIYSLGYAWRFLSLLKANDARRPWELLTAGLGLFLVFEFVFFLSYPDNEFIRYILLLGLNVLFLFVFILQNEIMKKSNYETLTRKEFIPLKTKEIKKFEETKKQVKG